MHKSGTCNLPTQCTMHPEAANIDHSDSESEGDYLWVAASRRGVGNPRNGVGNGTGSQEREVEMRPRDPRRLLSTPTLPIGSRSRSAPPSSISISLAHIKSIVDHKGRIPFLTTMLAAPAVDLTFDDDEWIAPQPNSPRLYRAASVGNSWGVTSIGRGFDWKSQDEEQEFPEPEHKPQHPEPLVSHRDTLNSGQKSRTAWVSAPTIAKDAAQPPLLTNITPATPAPRPSSSASFAPGPLTGSPIQSQSTSPRPLSPAGLSSSLPNLPPSISSAPSSPRLSTVPRPRRRSSQQRVSLVAGRVSIAPVEPPSPPPTAPQKFVRANSAASFLSVASSVGAPAESEHCSAVGERSISEFVIEREIGRGAYGLVKRAREMNVDGTLGPPLVIKQIIKSRILADCWKRHPKYGTIPIEIYVMSAISSTSYVLPPRRPWHPTRNDPQAEDDWEEGKTVKGHPNICPLIDFFEDNHYYYLILPSTTPEPLPDQPPPPSDLFDLVESYPHGLPPYMIRSYLGQMADAMCFLHAKGIVHRDIKDENVVLGPHGKCVLIDFGSSGLVKKGGWDTFSGTLDYAGPEILRGERYQGKEQDVWAFGVVAYVMLVGECPFTTAAEAQEGLGSPFSTASMALDERCMECKEKEGEEADGGGALVDAATLVRTCLQVEVNARPTFERIIQSRFLNGHGGWGTD